MRSLRALWVVLACWTLVSGLHAAGTIDLLKDGESRAVIVVPVNCDVRTRDAATVLAEYLHRASEATVGFCDESAVAGKGLVRVHVGPGSYVQSLKLGLATDRDSEWL